MNKITKITFYIVLGLFSFIFSEKAMAARLYMVMQDDDASAHYRVLVKLDTQGESINALDLLLSFPEDPLKVESISNGNSIINNWIEEPRAFGNGKIIMSGIIPGGFAGDGLIAKIIFSGKKIGTTQLLFSDAKVLLNSSDAQTTKVAFGNLQLTVSEIGDTQAGDKNGDNFPPEKFKAYLAKENESFDGKWFVSFTAQDKDSGIDHYEVREATVGPFGGEWKRIEAGPYVLEKQSLLASIAIKAVDKAGHERVVTITPERLLNIYFALVGVIVIGVFIFSIKKFRTFLPHLP